MKRILIFLACMVPIITLAQETKKWSLKDCIIYGIEHNLTLQQSKIGLKRANLSYTQSKLNFLPSVSAGASAGESYGRAIDPRTNTYVDNSVFNNSYDVQAQMYLFNGGELIQKLLSQKMQTKVAEANKLNTTDEMVFSIMAAYYDVLFYGELTAINLAQADISRQNEEKMKALLQVGVKAEADLLEVKANKEKDELNYIQAVNSHLLAQNNLKSLMNIVSENTFVIENPEDANLPNAANLSAQPENLYRQFLSYSPLITSLKAQWDIAKKNVAISRSGYYPSLRLVGQIATGYYNTNKDNTGNVIAFEKQISDNLRKYIGISLQIPIFDRNQARYNVSMAKLQAEEARINLEQSELKVKQQVYNDYTQMKATFQEMQQLERQLQADKLAYDAMQAKFDQGLSNTLELYTAKNRAASTQVQLLKTKLTFEIKQKMMQYYQGMRFWE